MIIKAFEKKARELGFVGIGFSAPQEPVWYDRFCTWLREADIGTMSYLARHAEIRKDPGKLLTGVQTIISLAYPYPASKPHTPDGYAVSRYSTPKQKDYHLRLKQLAGYLCALIKDRFPESRSRICVDSAPILERSFAAMSGIGFIGKNNLLIIPGYGSFCYLAEILTTAPFKTASPQMHKSLCGSCTACIDKCPTGALRSPFFVNASKCLSYLTIESSDPVEIPCAEKMGTTFFGCDICQEVCPFNMKQPPVVSLPLTSSILDMSKPTFHELFGNSSLARAGLAKLQSTIRAIKQAEKTVGQTNLVTSLRGTREE